MAEDKEMTEEKNVNDLEGGDCPMSPKAVSAEFFGGIISYGSVLKMAKRGELPFHKIMGRYLAWPSELREWKAQNRCKNADIGRRQL